MPKANPHGPINLLAIPYPSECSIHALLQSASLDDHDFYYDAPTASKAQASTVGPSEASSEEGAASDSGESKGASSDEELPPKAAHQPPNVAKSEKRKRQRAARRLAKQAAASSAPVDPMTLLTPPDSSEAPTPPSNPPLAPQARRTKNKSRQLKKRRLDGEKSFALHGHQPSSKVQAKYVSPASVLTGDVKLPELPTAYGSFEAKSRGAYGEPSAPKLDDLLAQGYRLEQWDGR
jgi:hypothetical protein